MWPLTLERSTRVLAWSLSFLCSILTLLSLRKRVGTAAVFECMRRFSPTSRFRIPISSSGLEPSAGTSNVGDN